MVYTFVVGERVIFMESDMSDDMTSSGKRWKEYIGKKGFVVRPGPSHTDVKFDDGTILSVMNHHLKGERA